MCLVPTILITKSLKIEALSSTSIAVTSWQEHGAGNCMVHYDLCICAPEHCQNLVFENEFNSGKCISVQDQSQSMFLLLACTLFAWFYT